jgi:hypothetical protein
MSIVSPVHLLLQLPWRISAQFSIRIRLKPVHFVGIQKYYKQSLLNSLESVIGATKLLITEVKEEQHGLEEQ